ncbi:MAG: NUDIX domain-containing protein [Conexivisphaerales archaeon]
MKMHNLRRNEFSDPNLVVLVSVALIRNRKLLVIKEEDEPYHAQWVLPQGYPNKNETLAEAARREVKEEVGVDIDDLSLLGVYEDFKSIKGVITHIVIICYYSFVGENTEVHSTREAIDWAFIDPNNIQFRPDDYLVRVILDVKRLI